MIRPLTILPSPLITFSTSTSTAHFLTLLEGRDRFWAPQIARVRGKLATIAELDHESLALITTEAERIKGPNTARLGNLIWVVHKTHGRLQAWPSHVERNGPVAAFYLRRPRDEAARDDLQRQLIQKSTGSIRFDSDTGEFQVTDRPFVSKINPLAILREDSEIAGQISRDLASSLRRLFDFLAASGTMDARRDYRNLCSRLSVLIRHDRASLKGFFEQPLSFESWPRLRRALYATSDFVQSWRGRVIWTGAPFLFFLKHAEDLPSLRAFYHRVGKGLVKSIGFEGECANVEPLFPVRRGRAMAPTSYSYREEANVRCLPHPGNNWGQSDLVRPESEIVEDIQKFFRNLEERLGVTPAVIQRSLRIPYYFIRTARTTMVPAHMTDRILNRLELSDAEKERLRHLETLLAISRDRRQRLEKGPYIEQGRVLWYYRWLHQVHQRTLETVYRTDNTHEGVTEAEMGRAMLSDRAKILGVAAAIGVPRVFEDAFAEAMLRGYEKVFKKVSGPREMLSESFPNISWTIPFVSMTDEAIAERLGSFQTDDLRKAGRADLARRAGLEKSRAHALALQGTLWAAAREAELHQAGREDEAGMIRRLRAAHELRNKPIGDRGGHYRAGRLLRYTRLLMAGWSAEDVIGELGLEMNPPTYTYWEWGFNRMPDSVLNAYSRLLVRRGVLTAKEADGFAARIREIYRP